MMKKITNRTTSRTNHCTKSTHKHNDKITLFSWFIKKCKNVVRDIIQRTHPAPNIQQNKKHLVFIMLQWCKQKMLLLSWLNDNNFTKHVSRYSVDKIGITSTRKYSKVSKKNEDILS